MFPPVRSAYFTDRLQALVPPGVQARAVYASMGRIVGLGLARGRNVAKVPGLRKIIERDTDRQLRLAAEFLLGRLDRIEPPYPKGISGGS